MLVKTSVKFGSALATLKYNTGTNKQKILSNQAGIHHQGVLPIMTYTEILRLNEVPFFRI